MPCERAVRAACNNKKIKEALVWRSKTQKRAEEAMIEKAGGGLTVKTRQGFGVFPLTSLVILHLRRLRQMGVDKEKVCHGWVQVAQHVDSPFQVFRL